MDIFVNKLEIALAYFLELPLLIQIPSGIFVSIMILFTLLLGLGCLLLAFLIPVFSVFVTPLLLFKSERQYAADFLSWLQVFSLPAMGLVIILGKILSPQIPSNFFLIYIYSAFVCYVPWFMYNYYRYLNPFGEAGKEILQYLFRPTVPKSSHRVATAPKRPSQSFQPKVNHSHANVISQGSQERVSAIDLTKQASPSQEFPYDVAELDQAAEKENLARLLKSYAELRRDDAFSLSDLLNLNKTMLNHELQLAGSEKPKGRPHR
jgi:hypothetical protein